MTDFEVRPVDRWEWERIIRRLVVGAPVKHVALTMATYADADGTRVRPGEARLVGATQLGATTVRRGIHWLRDNGLIVRVQAGSSYRKRSDSYRLSVPIDTGHLTLIDPDESNGTTRRPVHPRPSRRRPRPAEPAGDTGSDPGRPPGEPVGDTGSPRTQPAGDTGSGAVNRQEIPSQPAGDTAHQNSDHPPLRPDHSLGRPAITSPTRGPTAGESHEIPAVPLPDRCAHGLRPRVRPDGTVWTCPACRREIPDRPHLTVVPA